LLYFIFSSRRRHTRYIGDWSSDVCSSDLKASKRDKMREIISNKFQSLAVEMGEAASLEEQQKLQSLILALLKL